MASEGTQLEASPARKAQRGLKDFRGWASFCRGQFLGRRHSRRASDGQRLRAEAAHGSSGRLSGEFFKDGILRRL